MTIRLTDAGRAYLATELSRLASQALDSPDPWEQGQEEAAEQLAMAAQVVAESEARSLGDLRAELADYPYALRLLDSIRRSS